MLRIALTVFIGAIFVLLLAQGFIGNSANDPQQQVRNVLKDIAASEQRFYNLHGSYGCAGQMFIAGDNLPGLEMSIPDNSPYEFRIEEWKGQVTIRAYANLDKDTTKDFWAMSLGEGAKPICLKDDRTE